METKNLCAAIKSAEENLDRNSILNIEKEVNNLIPMRHNEKNIFEALGIESKPFKENMLRLALELSLASQDKKSKTIETICNTLTKKEMAIILSEVLG